MREKAESADTLASALIPSNNSEVGFCQLVPALESQVDKKPGFFPAISRRTNGSVSALQSALTLSVMRRTASSGFRAATSANTAASMTTLCTDQRAGSEREFTIADSSSTGRLAREVLRLPTACRM